LVAKFDESYLHVLDQLIVVLSRFGRGWWKLIENILVGGDFLEAFRIHLLMFLLWLIDFLESY
jgi:hypothetical protein